MASIKNTGVAGRNKQYEQQQQAGGSGRPTEGQLPPPVMPPLTTLAKKNGRVQLSRNQAPTPQQPQQPPATRPPRLGDYQTTSTAIDPRRILQRNSAQQALQSQVFASIDQVNKGEANWVDVVNEERQKILSDPNFYKDNQITQYSPAVQQQILADPNFDWKQLPKWQQTYYSLSSNPTAMGAVQGLVMGAGNPGGALLGGTLGWASSVLGYDPNKEFWQQGDDKLTFDAAQAQDIARGAFGLLNWGAEQAEKAIGLGVQTAAILTGNDPNFDPTKRNLSWDAGAGTFEAMAPAIKETGWIENSKNLVEKLGNGEPLTVRDFLRFVPVIGAVDMFINPEEYKGEEYYLGAAMPEELKQTFYERLQEAEQRINNGEDYRAVAMEMQNGILAQVGDMAGQGIADPLNFVGKAEAKAGEVTARISGDKIAAEAFSQSNGLMDARQRIQNLVNNPAEALKIDPNYKVTELGWITKSMANLTPEGKIKAGLLPSAGGLLDYTPPKKSLTGFIESLTSLTPESRARVGQDLLVRNLGSIMASYFNGNDVAGFSQWWKAFSKGDMSQSAELSRTMAQAPEFYTVLPAAKGFDIDGQLSVWETSEPARMAVSRIADVLGENPMTFIEDVAKRGTGPEDFARIQEKLQGMDTPEAKALLADIQAGRFTESNLTEAVNAFSDGSIPFHPGQWMAETLDAIKEHYDQWAVDHFKLEEESRKTLFRVSAVMKSAQSILLLGANPGYMISNVLPTMVTRAASGVYGYMTPGAIDTFFSRMGFSLDEGFAPNRLTEGVGPGGLIDQTRQTGDAIREATLGKGKLTDIQRAIGRIGSAMPFNKLSRLLEGYEGKMAYAIGIKKMWGESWRRGSGFKEVPQALLTELTKTAGNRAADILYSAIESGMTKQEIQSIVTGRSADIRSRSLINQAAQDLNIPASKAASMLEQMGVLDALDANLKGANTESRVRAAFENARKTAQAEIDRQASRDAVARIEHITNRIQTEGLKAITDVVLDTEMQGIEKWLQHYERMGEAADVMDSIPNPETRNRIWGLKYSESNAEYRRHAAVRGSTYLGILKAIGLDASESGRGWLSTIADTDRVLDSAYRQMRDLRDQHFKKWNNEWDNPRRGVERGQIESQIDKVWKAATKTEVQNLAKMGELLGQQYEALFSPEAGEAARQSWEAITEFRKEMVKRRDDFRKTLEGAPAAERQIMSKEFWQNNYNYMIVEMARIKQEAIARLDRIALNGKGGDPTGAGAGLDPNRPSGGTGGGVINPEMEALRQQAAERQRIQKEKISALWDTAEAYSKALPGNSSNYDRGYLQDSYALLGALKKEEYGGDPSIRDLKDAADKLTPEEVKAILDRRTEAKQNTIATEEAERVQRFQQATQDAALRASTRKTAENLTILQNIRKRGGIDIASWMNFGDKPEGYQPGVFSRTGKNRWALDQMARLLADDGYPIDINDPADIGGVNQLVALIGRARAGDEIFPVGHEFVIDAEVNKAQAAFIEGEIQAGEFNPDQWTTDMMDAFETADFGRMTDLIEQVPAEVMDTQYNATGETYKDYIGRSWDEMTAKLQADQQDMSIAENQVRAEQAVRQQEDTANTSMTRQLFRDKLQDVFGLNEDMTETVMSLTDARAESWAALGNGSADDWYATRIADVVKAGDGVDLAQEAYHGTPHKFDQFTLDHIGSGEGAQAYGWGLYFAGDKSVAEWYRSALSSDKGTTYKGLQEDQLASLPEYGTQSFYAARDVLKQMIKGKTFEESIAIAKDNFLSDANLNEAAKQSYSNAVLELSKDDFKQNKGQLYKVDLPDENYLMWDKPLSEQNIPVDDILASAANTAKDYKTASRLASDDVRGRLTAYSKQPDGTGQTFYHALISELGSDKAASLALKEAGINGIQYFDGNSRGKGEGNYNYVIFDDAAIQIKETYYQTQGSTPEQAIQTKVPLRDTPENNWRHAFNNSTDYMEKASILRAMADNSKSAQELMDIAVALRTFTPEENNIAWAILKNPNATDEVKKAARYRPQNQAGAGPTNAKGGIQFLDDGKAIIRAFEKADVSTVVHEIGHIFRRDLQGTDLAIIEAWADVKNGTWSRAAEEKFARGFEKYLADGSAPTPKLRTVFEKFKSWMTNIYRAITGSPIDVDLSATVKEVFDRLLVGDRQTHVDVGDILMQLGYDPKTHYLNDQGKITRRPELNIRVDKSAATSQADAVVGSDFQAKLEALRNKRPVRTEQKVDTSIPAPAKGTDVWMMTEAEYKAMLVQEQKEFATRRLEQIGRNENVDVNYADKEAAKMQAILKRESVSYDLYGDARDSYRRAIEKALIDDQPVPENIRQAYYAMGKEGNLSTAEYRNLQQAGRGQIDTLFQDADPRMPLGGYEEAAGWLPQSEVMDEGWSGEVQPLLDKMQEAATRRLTEPTMDGAYKDLSPEGQKMLQQYLNGVTKDMASTKMAAQRWGAEKRDNAMLNYNERYGFDKMLDVVFPYQFFYTRSMMTWAMRALDKPAWLSNYARIRKQQDRYENNLPERLRGKVRIDAPWLPDWMGDGLYIDPLSVLFTPHNFLRPFEQMAKDKNMQVIEAERILQEWAADGTTSQEEIVQAAQTRSGSTWERALQEAKIRREAEISNPMDFVSTMFGPAWYLSTPAKLLNIGKDGPETLTELPLTRTARAVDTVTNNTWAEPIGNILGLLAKPEEAFREAKNLPQFGEYGDYYTDRNIANMVAEGLITPEEAQIAMIERQGEIFDAAVERTKLELAMRVPTAGFIYAALNEGVAAAAQASVPSLFGAQLLPTGELEYRGMKDEWNEAWKLRDAGDTEAINRFFEKNPEYEAYLAKGKEPEDRLRAFLIGQIWDGYMELGDTNRKQATAEMGDLFKQSFLNSETRSYDTLDIEQLTQWAQMLTKRVPNVPQTAPAIANPRTINYFSKEVTDITDEFYQQRKRMYGDYYELEQGYYNLPKSERAGYLIANPKLRNYWDWKDSWYDRYPDLVPVFKGQVFKRVDTSAWPLGLTDYVEAFAFSGEPLPNGAYKALEQVWINEGRPMGDFDTWLKSQVVPAIQYQAAPQP